MKIKKFSVFAVSVIGVLVFFVLQSPAEGADGHIVLRKQGEATAETTVFTSYDVIFKGSRWDIDTAYDVTGKITFTPAPPSYQNFPGGNVKITGSDNLVIADELGIPFVQFLRGTDGADWWHEASFLSDGQETMLNIRNTAARELGLRFFKGDYNNNPWCILILEQPGNGLIFLRDALIEVFNFDADGKLIIGRFPTSVHPASARVHVQGMVNETQTIVEASTSQSADVFEVTDSGRSTKHLLVNAVGNVGIGTANPQGKLDVNGTLYQRGSLLHADIAEEFPYNGELEAGDIAVIDVNDRMKIKRSEKPYEAAVAGIVSTSPAFQISPQSRESTVPLALSGRVPAKVTNENGMIRAGDLLTVSSRPGYAMKLELLKISDKLSSEETIRIFNENERRKTCIVGRALESCDQDTGTIMVLLRHR